MAIKMEYWCPQCDKIKPKTRIDKRDIIRCECGTRIQIRATEEK